MTKVCMVVHQYYYRDQRVKCYAEALVDLGVRVDVLCPRDPNHRPSGDRSAVRVFAIPMSRGYGGRGSYPLEYAVALILYSVWLLALYVKNRYQVIHVHNMPDCLVFTALIPRICGAKLILDIHDPMPEFYMSKYKRQSHSAAVRVMRVQEKLSAALANAVIAANPTFKENLVNRGVPAEKITVVNNVPDPRVFNRSEHRDDHHDVSQDFTMIYPGTIAPRYGLSVAIRALPLLFARIPRIRLLIIGPHVEHVDGLATLAQQLGVSDSVQFKPGIPVDEVPQEIARADVGIYTALPDPHMSIAVPSKVLEYAVMGIPIIASRLRVLENLFGESAVMFFEPGNVDEFARCVLELFDSPARRHELVRNADDGFVRTHSCRDERRAYFELLIRLLGPGSGEACLSDRDEYVPREAA
jgi:glycosyltransferase involved in cell wall biosynthesis